MPCSPIITDIVVEVSTLVVPHIAHARTHSVMRSVESKAEELRHCAPSSAEREERGFH